jgi:hypothetical protein
MTADQREAADTGACPECGAPWSGTWCESCGRFKPCSHCGMRTDVGGRCPRCGRSIFDDLDESDQRP